MRKAHNFLKYKHFDKDERNELAILLKKGYSLCAKSQEFWVVARLQQAARLKEIRLAVDIFQIRPTIRPGLRDSVPNIRE